MNNKYMELVGSRKRGTATNDSDYDYIALESDVDKIKSILEKRGIAKKLKWGDKYISVVLNNGKKIDVFTTTDLDHAQLIYSIPRDKLIGLKKIAKTMGMKLNQHGLFDKNDKKIKSKSYDDLKEKLDISNKGITIDDFTYYKSDRSSKKLMVYVDRKWLHFGNSSSQHYFDKTGLLDKKLNHNDKKRRQAYKKRHSAIRLKNGKRAVNTPNQPAWHAYRILW